MDPCVSTVFSNWSLQLHRQVEIKATTGALKGTANRSSERRKNQHTHVGRGTHSEQSQHTLLRGCREYTHSEQSPLLKGCREYTHSEQSPLLKGCREYTLRAWFSGTLKEGCRKPVLGVSGVHTHSEQSPMVSALSLTRVQLSGTSSLFLSVILPLSVLQIFIEFFFSFQNPFLQS